MTMGMLCSKPNSWADGAAGEELNRSLLGVDTEVVRGFLSELREKNYCKSTVARKLATLRSFYKFLVRRGVCDQ